MLLWTNYRKSVKTAALKKEIRQINEARDVRSVLVLMMNVVQFD